MSIVLGIILVLSIVLVQCQPWTESQHLDQWMQPFDHCLLRDSRNTSITEVTKDCIQESSAKGAKLLPVRCRVGNTWPSRSEYCDPSDIPFSRRQNLKSVVKGYDEPNYPILKEFFYKLAKSGGMFLMVGDSVMQQFFSALACQLEREGVWKDPAAFDNTDETRYVKFDDLQTSAVAKFIPLYHLVNGRYDRVPMAAFNHLKHSIHNAMKDHRKIVILINMGLHYVDNPVAGFSKDDYSQQVTTVLTYLQDLTVAHPQHKFHIIWRETTAQHFPTPNGYWPGVRYATGMKVGCEPLKDPSPKADWRNRAVEDIVMKHNFFNVKILRFYNVTVPLWSEHPNGHLRDCTHFCWSPMLYQPIFYYLNKAIAL